MLEGGSIHVDGEGTVLTTEMCLLSEGRNPDMDRGAIERMLCDYLGCEKVLWLRDGIDPEETNGHIDDVACFIRPGEVACIWTDDPQNPFYQPARDAYDMLAGDGRQGPQAEGAQALPDAAALPAAGARRRSTPWRARSRARTARSPSRRI